MKHVLNEHTGTIHKPRRGTADETVCGALRHVPRQNVTPVTNDESKTGDGVERCGRCFDDVGGY